MQTQAPTRLKGPKTAPNGPNWLQTLATFLQRPKPPSQGLQPELPQSIICGTAYDEENYVKLLVAHAVTIGVLILLLIWIIQFIRRMSLFPVKERAPRLALLQSFMFFFLILETYCAEFMIPYWDAERYQDIPYSRRVFKAMYFALRFFCYFIFGLRVLIIYSNWRLRKRGKGLWRLFKDETASLKIVLCSVLAAFLIGLLLSGCYITDYSALDWYNPEMMYGYLWMNFTTLHLLEVILLAFCSYVHRNYPNEFNITKEIFICFVTNYLINWYSEFFVERHLRDILNTTSGYHHPHPQSTSSTQYTPSTARMLLLTTSSPLMATNKFNELCIFGVFSAIGLGDILRAIAFMSSLIYCTRKCYGLFPLPFTWIFKDLSKFIFEPLCVKVFRQYLNEKEKGKSEYLEEIMRIYLRSFKDPEMRQFSSDVGTYLMRANETTSRQLFLEYINRLQPSFDRFKRTIAYKALYLKVQEFEQISERVYQ